MLREICCEMFRTGVIEFSPGLNVVLGDENATNSIGKSTLLMVIDFVFGGDTLLEHNSDVVAELGHHNYKFTFEFNGERHYFQRQTIAPDYVFVCNSAYEVESPSLSISEFTAWLKKAYALPTLDQTFRSAVGLHLRVWGKANLSVERPLHVIPVQPARECIDNLLKTFGAFDVIREREAVLHQSESSLKAVRAAGRSRLVPKVTKRQYVQAQEQITTLETELEEVKRNLASYATSLGAVINNEVLELKLRKDELLYRRLNVAGRLQRVERNLRGSRSLRSSSFRDLLRYFPEVNTERLEDVEAFHDGVAKILKQQLQDSKEQLTDELGSIDFEVADIDSKMGAALGSIEKPESLVDHVYKVALSLRDAQMEKESYEREAALVEAVRVANEALAHEKRRILSSVEARVNSAMRDIVNEVTDEHRKSPVLSLQDTRYTFEVFEDTGTGTAYFGLVLFDLAVFRTTCLPVVAHDSILFKNVENDSVSKLIDIYVQSEKQSFIALDEIQKYGERAVQILRDHCVIQLSDQAVLYIKDWRQRRPASAQTENS